MTRVTLTAAVLGLAVAAAPAQIPGLPSSAKDELAGDLRALLLKNLPAPLYEASPNWGHQEMVERLRFRGKLRDLHAEVNHEPKNDGVWRKIRVEAINPADTLVLDLRHVNGPEPGK